MAVMNANKMKKFNHLNKISELKGKFNSVVMVSHFKLPNEKISQFRDVMFENGNQILFIKNKIANLSFKDAKFEDNLENSNFLIFGNDIFALLKSCNDFVKSLRLYPEAKISIMSGFLDSSFLDKDEVKSLEKIPSKESLYVSILGTVLYPMRTLVRLLDTHVKNHESSCE